MMLQGRTAVVTGATGGMGRAITLRFAAEGANVLASDCDEAAGAALIDAADLLPGEVDFIAADVINADQVEAVVNGAVSTFGKLDCAVNAAAVEFEQVPLHECTLDDYERMMAINATGVFLSMKYELAALIAGGDGGSIVNIASTNSFTPQQTQPAYTASKHAVLGLTRSAALDYARHDIRVNAICPGAIDTPMLRNAMQRRERDADEVAKRLSPFGRFGRPDEIADAALWLCSNGSTFTTGHALGVDGGMLI